MNTPRIALGAHPVIGFGHPALVAPAVAASPWKVALVTSVASAATGWALEEAARRVRSKRR